MTKPTHTPSARHVATTSAWKVLLRAFMLAPLVATVLPMPTVASNEITNYKCGISIALSGQPGKDYAFERWYFDAYHNLGRPFGIYANLMKMHFGQTRPYLDKWLERNNDSTQPADRHGKTGHFNALVVNDYFNEAGISAKALKTLGESDAPLRPDVYGLLLIRPDKVKK